MEHSYSERGTCKNCGEIFNYLIWFIVDVLEYPDITQRIREGTIHTAVCPHCGAWEEVKVPLLIHHPKRQWLLLSPSQGSSGKEAQEKGEPLFVHLAKTFFPNVPDYLLDRLSIIPRNLLPIMIDTDDPDAKLKEVT